MNYPTDTLDWKGKRFNLTWIRTDSFEGYSPIRQVYGICFNDKNEILIQRAEGGKWNLPGGTTEGKETALQTLERELMEEVDVKVKNVRFLGLQKVQSVENPEEIIYQARCVCEIDELLSQTPDPDGGMMRERKFVPATKITEYIKWGKLGEIIFKDAINLCMHI